MFGPLYTSDVGKTYGVIFTCAISRAVHLELATSFSAEAFLRVFQRFVSRRRKPSIIWSDNGTNFHPSEKILREWFEREGKKKIGEWCSVEKIYWRFNPPSASWFGGFFERLIGLAKSLL